MNGISERAGAGALPIDPARKASRVVREDISDRVYQGTLMRALSRHWRSELSDREYTMLAYIMDHTVEWGRLAYRFTYKSLAEGTPVSPCGLNKGEQQLREILSSLERMGAISVTRGRDGLGITFNPQWRPVKSTRKRPAEVETPLEIQGGDPWKSIPPIRRALRTTS